MLLIRVATWNTRGLSGSAASSQKPRESKLKYLERIAEKSKFLCLQETHGRIEHHMNIDVLMDRTTWMTFGTLNMRKFCKGVIT